MFKQINKKRLLSLVFTIILAAAAGLFSLADFPSASQEGVALYAFNVEQGDAYLFRFPDGANMLVDTGSRKYSRDLALKLRRLGVSKIDVLVASHPHEDHIGGMAEIINSFEIGKVWDSGYNHGSAAQRAMLEAIKRKNIRFGRPKAGFTENFGEASVKVIAPVKPISGTSSDANNNSIVLHVSYGEVSFLMTGDIEEAGRQAAAPFPRATILKISHHGSRNGTDRELLEQVSPSVAVISCGIGNSYGHPHKETLRLLKKFKVKSYSTTEGDIVITTDGANYIIKQGGA